MEVPGLTVGLGVWVVSPWTLWMEWAMGESSVASEVRT